MVPMLTCGLVRSNFAFATVGPPVGLVRFRARARDDPEPGWCKVLLRFALGELLAADLLDDLLRDVPGNLGVGVELHGVDGPALRLAAQVADVAEHLRERDNGADDLGAARVLHGLDLPTA